MVRCLVLALGLVAPVAAATVDPSGDGPFAVGVKTATLVDAARGRTLVTEVWYPARTDTRDAEPRRGRFPLVLVAHGNCGYRTNYDYLSIALASWGFVVAAPDFPGFNKADCDAGVSRGDVFADPPRDLSFLRGVLHDRHGPAAAIARLVRGRRTGLAGHSLGGLAVVNAALADPAMRVVVALAPATGEPQGADVAALRPRRAVLVEVGTADPLTVLGRAFFAALAPPAFLVTIVGGTHSGFTDVDALRATSQLLRQETLARRYAVALMKRYLARDRRFGPVLTPGDAAAQGFDVELTPAD